MKPNSLFPHCYETFVQDARALGYAVHELAEVPWPPEDIAADMWWSRFKILSCVAPNLRRQVATVEFSPHAPEECRIFLGDEIPRNTIDLFRAMNVKPQRMQRVAG